MLLATWVCSFDPAVEIIFCVAAVEMRGNTSWLPEAWRGCARCRWVNLDDEGEEGAQRELPKLGVVRLRAERFKARWVRLSYAECN